MADVPPDDAIDPDELLIQQITDKYDLSKPQVVGFRIDFSPVDARQAAADLIRAGHDSVRLEMEGAPSVVVTTDMLVTLDSLRALRAQLDAFANGLNASVINVLVGGVDPLKKEVWTNASAETADTDGADQHVIDQLVASNVDLKQTMKFRGGIGFSADGAARESAAALMLEGFPEVAVVVSDIGPVALAVMYMTGDVKALHKVRHNLSSFAANHGGTWLGFHVIAHAPAK